MTDWNRYYPFSWVQALYPVPNPTFTAENKVTDFAYYSALNVPYKYVDVEIID